MQHCDPDVLSLAALGEPLAERDAAHLSDCALCRDELADLTRVVSGVRVDVAVGPVVPPPPAVWDRIAAETGVTVRPGSVGGSPPPPPASPPASAAPPIPWARAARRPATPPPGRRRLVAVAAAALVVGAASGSAITHAVQRPEPVTVVMQVPLSALPDAPGAVGKAKVVDAHGGRELVVDVSRLTNTPGQFYEVWLIDRSVQKMVAVGILQGTQGRFTVPSSVELDQYPVVDISVQQPGDPRHSGHSVLRGTLPA